ncbi:MAG: MAPEG family protein [Alphaproteobacteria bacterium]|nr:MAPEG family protein [Alphaproteobacteria bacterium]
MTKELFWLTLTAAMTAVLWVPYILDRILVRGTAGAMANPSPADKPQSAWAQRMIKAHENAIENLAVFATLVLVAKLAGVSTGATVLAAQLYFWARLAHVAVYTAGIPVLRTLAFAGGFVAQVIFILALLG